MFAFIARLFSLYAPVMPSRAQLPAAEVDSQEEEDGTENLVVLRHAVLDRNKKVVGYEFFQLREAGANLANPQQERSFLKFLQSVVDGTELGKRRAFTAVSSHLLFDPLLEKLAKAGVIVLVHFDPGATDLSRFSERMQAMRNAGMVLGLADARVALANPALGNCARLGFLPMNQIILPDLLQSVRLLTTRHPKMQLCASGVKFYEEFEVCRRLRMRGFIGPFSTHRRDWQNNTIDPGTLRLCKLVTSLRAGAEMDAIIKEIKLDPLLSYRLLCYANSAAIGAQHKILALKDAILLIGREPLFRWLVLLMCASAPSRSEDNVLLENALVRGRMMEVLSGKISPDASDNFFLTGVLSLLDVILQMPAPALFNSLDLSDEMKSALLERKGPYSDLLRLAEASETPTEGINDLCHKLGIEPQMLSSVQSEALIWARGQNQNEADEASFVTDQPATASVQDAKPDIVQQQMSVVHELNLTDQAPTDPLTAEPDPLFDAAQSGDVDAQCALGARYARGDNVLQDLAKSLEWYTKAAQQGSAKAQWNVAVIFSQRSSGDQDSQQAFQWYQKAADQGFVPAQAALGLMYAAGLGVEKDVDKAQALLQQAALQGDMEAQYNLAILHEKGLAGEPNLEQALVWFSKAAEQGFPKAQERLGLMFAIGQPMEQDLIEAHKWFFIASEGNQEAAKANLAHSLTLMDADQVTEAESRARLWMQNHAATHDTQSQNS